MSPEELFDITGELQGVLNATEGAQLVATAHAAAHETRLTDRGPVQVHRGLGFVDAMAPSEVSLATGTSQWAAGRRVSLAAALAERFPRLLAKVLDGAVGSGTVHKVVSECEGLDAEACAAVEAVLAERLADLDPSRVTTTTRRVATRVAPDQVRDAQRRHTRDRCVQVSPGPDGTSTWWAQLPSAASAAAWSAITTLADTYGEEDPSLTVDQARADAFVDLLLGNVQVHAKVTLGIPVITTPGHLRHRRDGRPPGWGVLALGRAVRGASCPGSAGSTPTRSRPCSPPCPSTWAAPSSTPAPGPCWRPRARPTGRRRRSATSSPPGLDLPDVGLRPPRHHLRPRPRASVAGRPAPPPRTSPGLCRRHHRLKQRRRWTYRIAPRRQRHLDLTHRQATHDPARPRRLATAPATAGAGSHCDTDAAARARLGAALLAGSRGMRRGSGPRQHQVSLVGHAPSVRRRGQERPS